MSSTTAPVSSPSSNIDQSDLTGAAGADPCDETKARAAFVTLANLDGYMENLGYDSTHPWRREIAATIAGASSLRPPAPPHHGVTSDAAMDIESAVCVARTLLAIASEDCLGTEMNRALTAMMAAERYLDDIELLARGVRKGGAA